MSGLVTKFASFGFVEGTNNVLTFVWIAVALVDAIGSPPVDCVTVGCDAVAWFYCGASG